MTDQQPHKKWYVIVASAIHYKKAIAILEKLGFSFYLPLQRQLRYWSDRKKWVDVPILSPYIFLHTNEQERNNLFQSGDFFRFLHYQKRPAIVQQEEVEKVKLLCNHALNLKMEQRPVQKGDMVEITSGPLAGIKGFACRENGKHRFLVSISGLGQFASVDVDSSWLNHC